MMNQILKVYDSQGKLVAVQISPELWERCQKLLASAVERQKTLPQAMDEFERFISSWNYKYAYDPAVECPLCHAKTSDWRKDENFALKTVSLGGTMIFLCNSCGANVRQKYFRYKTELEATPKG